MTSNPARALRCAIYLRVSQEAQAGKAAKKVKAVNAGRMNPKDVDLDGNDKDSLPNQERECRAYAAAHGWEVVGVFVDVETSRHWEERPQMQRLLRAAQSREIDVFLGWKLDRVLRDQLHLGVLLHQLRKAGCTFDLVKEKVEDTTMGRFVLAALALAAEIERENIRLRTQSAIEARVAAGKLRGGGMRAPYGYGWNDDHSAYVVKEQEAEVVQRIFRDYLAGESIAAIAAALAAENVPTPFGGFTWHRSSVRNILANECYLGYVFVNKRQVIAPGERLLARRDPSEWRRIDDVAPPLVTPEDWEAARERRSVAQKSVRRQIDLTTAEHPTLLHGGYIRCGYCQSRMIRSGASQSRILYRCTNYERGCNWGVTATHIDPLVWERIAETLEDPAVIERELARQQDAPDFAPQLEALAAQAKQVARQQANLAKAIALMDPENEDGLTPLAAEMESLGRQARKLREEEERVRAKEEQIAARRQSVRQFVAWCRTVRDNVAAATPALKRVAVEAFGIEVTVWKRSEGRSPRIESNIPLDSDDGTGPWLPASSEVGSGLSTSSRSFLAP